MLSIADNIFFRRKYISYFFHSEKTRSRNLLKRAGSMLSYSFIWCPAFLSLHFKILKNGPEKTHMIVRLSSATVTNPWHFTTLTRVIADNSTCHQGDLKWSFLSSNFKFLRSGTYLKQQKFPATPETHRWFLCFRNTGDVDINGFFVFCFLF